MPFFDGQGLHDAPWRGEFGGSIYVENGSHGCVNLPPSVARTIYENIEVGTAIIIYKE
jgi:lipoprotein-anchoring transpeptidase ErfK/SrfK